MDHGAVQLSTCQDRSTTSTGVPGMLGTLWLLHNDQEHDFPTFKTTWNVLYLYNMCLYQVDLYFCPRYPWRRRQHDHRLDVVDGVGHCGSTSGPLEPSSGTAPPSHDGQHLRMAIGGRMPLFSWFSKGDRKIAPP